MKIERGKVVFSSGRERHCNCGIIGLGPDGSVSEGYDGSLWSSAFPDSEIHDAPLTDDDLIELADFMIARWTEFRERAAQRRSGDPK